MRELLPLLESMDRRDDRGKTWRSFSTSCLASERGVDWSFTAIRERLSVGSGACDITPAKGYVCPNEVLQEFDGPKYEVIRRGSRLIAGKIGSDLVSATPLER
jgi:hypothetical protein